MSVAEVEAPVAEWVTGAVVSREGLAGFTHIIRAKGDPERTSSAERRAKLGREAASNEWKRVTLKTSVAEWRARILEHLGDGNARTFNRIMVELADVTADVAADKNPDKALWVLVADELVEHTMLAPILFRARADAPELHRHAPDEGADSSQDHHTPCPFCGRCENWDLTYHAFVRCRCGQPGLECRAKKGHRIVWASERELYDVVGAALRHISELTRFHGRDSFQVKAAKRDLDGLRSRWPSEVKITLEQRVEGAARALLLPLRIDRHSSSPVPGRWVREGVDYGLEAEDWDDDDDLVVVADELGEIADDCEHCDEHNSHVAGTKLDRLSHRPGRGSYPETWKADAAPALWRSDGDGPEGKGQVMCSWCGVRRRRDGTIHPLDTTQNVECCPRCPILTKEGAATAGKPITDEGDDARARAPRKADRCACGHDRVYHRWPGGPKTAAAECLQPGCGCAAFGNEKSASPRPPSGSGSKEVAGRRAATSRKLVEDRALLGLHVALTIRGGCEKRWAKLTKSGATDAEVLERVGYELGTAGGTSAPGMPGTQFWGGKKPRVIVSEGGRSLKIDGASLLRGARWLYKIALPGEKWVDTATYLGEAPAPAPAKRKKVAKVTKYRSDTIRPKGRGIVGRQHEPGTPYSGKFVLRIAPELHERIAAIAEQEKRSLNAQLEVMLERVTTELERERKAKR